MTPHGTSIALGAASGLRATYGLAALSRSQAPGLATGPLGWLTSPRGRRVALTLGATESLIDVLPGTSSRLRPPALLARVLTGSVSAALAAHRESADLRGAARTGAGAAAAAAVVGWGSRRVISRNPKLARRGALLEDAVCAGLAVAGARRTSPS